MTHFYGQLKMFWGFFTIFSDCVLLLWGLGDTGRYLLPQWGSTEGRAGLRRVPQEGQGTLKEAVRCQGHHAEGQRKGRTIHINSECGLGFSSILFAKNDACAKSLVFSVPLFSKLFRFFPQVCLQFKISGPTNSSEIPPHCDQVKKFWKKILAAMITPRRISIW